MMLQSGEIRGVGKEDEDDGVGRSISIRELGWTLEGKDRKGKEGESVLNRNSSSAGSRGPLKINP